MRKEIEMPKDVNAVIDRKNVIITGPKGKLERQFKYFYDVKIEKQDNTITVSSESEKRKVKALVGAIVAHIRNMIVGVRNGYIYRMKAVYTHFPINIKVEGRNVLITNFIGEKTPRKAKIVGDTKVEIKGQDLTLSGIDIESVSQTSANIEQTCRVKKVDRRVFMDGIYITSKGETGGES